MISYRAKICQLTFVSRARASPPSTKAQRDKFRSLRALRPRDVGYLQANQTSTQ